MLFSMLKILILKTQSIFMSDFYCISYKRFSKWHLKIYPTLHVGQSVLVMSVDWDRKQSSVWALNLLVAHQVLGERTHITMDLLWAVNTFCCLISVLSDPSSATLTVQKWHSAWRPWNLSFEWNSLNPIDAWQ
jgi:hypothetical protein